MNKKKKVEEAEKVKAKLQGKDGKGRKGKKSKQRRKGKRPQGGKNTSGKITLKVKVKARNLQNTLG